MGNLISIHGNDVYRLASILRFFAKRVIVKSSNLDLAGFQEEIYKTPTSMEFCAEYIIDNQFDRNFKGIIIETYHDLSNVEICIPNNLDNFVSVISDDSKPIELLNDLLRKIKVYGYEKEFGFYSTGKIIMLGFSMLSLDSEMDEAMEKSQQNLMFLRNEWVKSRRLDFSAGIGAFGLII
jgi:hypothetical protein